MVQIMFKYEIDMIALIALIACRGGIVLELEKKTCTRFFCTIECIPGRYNDRSRSDRSRSIVSEAVPPVGIS